MFSQQRCKFPAIKAIEAIADLGCELELGAIEIAHDQGLELGGRWLVSTNHERLAPVQLQLQPVPAPLAGKVARLTALGHDSLDAKFRGVRDNVTSIPRQVLRQPNR